MPWFFWYFAVTTALAATPFLQSDFDNGPGGWTKMGDSGSLHVSRETEDLRDGKTSLALDYEIGPKKFALAVLPVEPAAIAAMEQIHFWIKTDFPTSVVVTLNEKGGGNYSAIAWSPGKVWQEVRVEPRDFSLSDRPNDPIDPDGKLDLDAVQGIGIADLAQIFSGAPRNASVPIVFADSTGKHTLLINGFEVLKGLPIRKDSLAIDLFDAPQISWLSPGGAILRVDTSGDHAPAPALEVAYTLAGNAIVYFVRNLPPAIPGDVTHISFDVASENAGQFVFTLQEKGSGHGEGPRYNTIVEVKGKAKSDHRDLALSAFNLDQNGPADAAGALDIARVKSLAIADVSAAIDGAAGPNRFWISNIRLTR